MSEEQNYKIAGIVALIIFALLIGLYIGAIPYKKQVNQFNQLFSTCTDYCKANSQIGFIRHELSDNHYKCFCYSDTTKKMEEK